MPPLDKLNKQHTTTTQDLYRHGTYRHTLALSPLSAHSQGRNGFTAAVADADESTRKPRTYTWREPRDYAPVNRLMPVTPLTLAGQYKQQQKSLKSSKTIPETLPREYTLWLSFTIGSSIILWCTMYHMIRNRATTALKARANAHSTTSTVDNAFQE